MDVARKWYLKLEDEAGNDQVFDQFEEWLGADPSHRDSFNAVVDFWSHIDNLPELQEVRETGSDIMSEFPQAPDENIIVDLV